MHLLITRPSPEAEALEAELASRGMPSTIDPLLTITFTAPSALGLAGVCALIATSRNGLRGLALSPLVSMAIERPIYVVGPGTADLARELGFRDIRAGVGTARDLVPLIAHDVSPAAGIVLHVSGDKIAFDLAAALKPHGVTVDRLIVYCSQPSDHFAPTTLSRLRDGTIDTVLLTSPLAAETFVKLVRTAEIDQQCQRLVYVCLSQGIARCLSPLNPTNVHVALAPNSRSTLELIDNLAAKKLSPPSQSSVKSCR